MRLNPDFSSFLLFQSPLEAPPVTSVLSNARRKSKCTQSWFCNCRAGCEAMRWTVWVELPDHLRYVSHTCLKPPVGPDFCLYSPERFTNASSDNDINHTSTMIWLSKYPIPKSQWTSHGPKSVPPSTSRLLGSSLDLCPSVRPQLSTTWGWQHLLEPGFWDDDYMITPLKINIFEGDWKPHTINDI